MGISKRNPRGNFNWQTRYLKKKAICCGQLNEPVDCNALAPIVQLTDYVICKTLGNDPMTITAINMQPSQITTWEWYFNNTLISSSDSYIWINPTIADEGMYKIIATNEYGCITEYDVYLTYVEEPDVVATLTDPTPPACDGEILLTINNPIAGIAYKYNIVDPTTSAIIFTATTSFSSHNFTGICLGQYAYQITPIVTNSYGVFESCATKPVLFNLPTPTGPAFTLGFTAGTISSDLPFLDAPFSLYNVDAWNQLMGSDYQVCIVDSVNDEIRFYYTAGNLAMSFRAFSQLSPPPVDNDVYAYLTTVDDPNGDFTILYGQCFDSMSVLKTVDFPAVTYIDSGSFSNCPLTTVSFATCNNTGSSAFSGCSSLDNPIMPLVTIFSGRVFEGCSLLTRANNYVDVQFPNLVSTGQRVFKDCTSITSIKLNACLTVGAEAFYGCTSLQVCEAPVATFVGPSAFNGMDGLNLVSIDFSSCTSMGSANCNILNYIFWESPGVLFNSNVNFTLKVPVFLATCANNPTPGLPEADLSWVLGYPLTTVIYI